MASAAHTTRQRVYETPLAYTGSAANDHRGAAPKPEGDPWVPLLAALQQWPRVAAFAWSCRAQGMSLEHFCDRSIDSLQALGAQ